MIKAIIVDDESNARELVGIVLKNNFRMLKLLIPSEILKQLSIPSKK